MTIERTTQGGDLQTREKQAVERERTRPGLVFRPEVDIVERPEEFVVTADLPGVDREHVEIRLEEGVLSIDGTLTVAPEPGWTARHTEYQTGAYHREFALSDGIDVDAIEATMRNGVLELHLPKSDRHRPRRIEVQGA
jgi:HSP20 family protein